MWRGDKFMAGDNPIKKKHDDVKNDIANDSFDYSYSNEIKEHLNSVNMDPWYYVYENYVNPDLKKRKDD